MKLLILNSSNNYFGAELSLLVLLRSLETESFDLVIQDEPGDFEARLKSEAIAFRKIRLNLSPRKLKFFKTCYGLAKIIMTGKHDIVYGNNDDLSVLLAAIKAISFGRVKTFLHIRNKPEKYTYFRRLMFLHNRVCANSKFTKRSLIDSLPVQGRNVSVIYNAHGRSTVKGFRKNPEGKVLLSAGRFSPWKGQLDVLDALYGKGMFDELDKYYFIGAGKSADNGYQRSVEDFIVENGLTSKVKVMGFTSEIDEYYRKASVVIVPSVDEPFGRVVIEAGFWGLPVIARDSGALPELIEHEKNGLLWDGSPSQLATHVRSLLNDSGYAESLGNNLRRDALTKYSDSNYVESLWNTLKLLEK